MIRARRLLDKQERERGDLTVEAAAGTVGLILLFGLAVVALRVVTADSSVDEAARAAARSASLAREGVQAAGLAERRAHEVLAEQDLACSALTVSVDTHDFALPYGQDGYVTADVSCTIPISDVVPGIGGSMIAHARFRSPIDRYGART